VSAEPEPPSEAERRERDVAEALVRSARHRFVAAAFTAPDASLAERLGPSRWPDREDDPPALSGAVSRLRATLADADLAALAAEHVALFASGVRCSPHESSYGDARRLGGKEAELADIAGFHAAFGLDLSDECREAPDHVAAELELMSLLALKEAWAAARDVGEAREVTRRAQASFLSEHLGRWTGVFAQALRGATAQPYYAAAAELLAAWVSADVRSLGASPRPIDLTVIGGDPAESAGFTCPLASSEGGEA
jgi:TorA maturation chaperone TorD